MWLFFIKLNIYAWGIVWCNNHIYALIQYAVGKCYSWHFVISNHPGTVYTYPLHIMSYLQIFQSTGKYLCYDYLGQLAIRYSSMILLSWFILYMCAWEILFPFIFSLSAIIFCFLSSETSLHMGESYLPLSWEKLNFSTGLFPLSEAGS